MAAIMVEKKAPSDKMSEAYFLDQNGGWTPLPGEAKTFWSAEEASQYIEKYALNGGMYAVSKPVAIEEIRKYNHTWKL